MTAALAVAVLVTGSVYLLLQPGLLRTVAGFVLLGHAVNVVLISAGGMHRRDAPLIGQHDPGQAADPLPQAFVLTAIVISFGITGYLLGLLLAGGDAEAEHAWGEDGAGENGAGERGVGEDGVGEDARAGAEGVRAERDREAGP